VDKNAGDTAPASLVPAHARRCGYAEMRDPVIASILLAITWPLIIGVAVVIKWESSGPALVTRSRIGRDGRPFRLLEFRVTLHHLESGAVVWRRDWTRVGLFLHHTRINTLPQLINVVRGEMPLTDMDLYSLL
jgi:lipopolysaccharide/colanic/teichoic acid biosynthesis glycosyltransferase